MDALTDRLRLAYPMHPKALLEEYNLKPIKSLGQNFLIDGAALQRIIEAAEIAPGDTVLEIGPGLGVLTERLAERAGRVVAVELDERLRPPLLDVLAASPNVELVFDDILEADIPSLISEPGYLVVGNIPYYITSALIRRLLENRSRPRRIVLTVQREVAERMNAGPGKMSLLSLSVQLYGRPRVVARIPAGSFYPSPKVDSSVVRIDLPEDTSLPPETAARLFRLAKAGFGQKRKTLLNALSAGLARPKTELKIFLEQAGIEPSRRAQTLSVEEWIVLASRYTEQTGQEV